ncbi:MAG: LLM class flavin-dependent oxidoreductase [Candidatus Binatia bacterium]|jgi:5,10-methylenetetrahydromethanopterin reductase|nr:LLM class flavin-dependent oxidoreductase [Candidatus Binatia bacterium]
MKSLAFGAGLFPTEPMPRMIRLAKLSEELGFSHVWIGDSHLIWREAYVNMAAAALSTTKVKLGTGVTNPLTRHPSVVASAYATLEELAPGRMIVGIGLGDSSVETMGMKPARLSYFEKTLVQMRDLFAGKEVELETGKIHIKHPCKGKVPIYVAASGPKMLELSGRIADGIIILVGVTDEYLRQAKERIEAGAKVAGRKLSDIDLVLWAPCAVSDKARAKDAVKAHVARVVAHPQPYVLNEREQKVLAEIRQTYDYYYHMEQQANHAEVIPDWLVDKFAIAGTREECRAKVEEVKKSGINQIAIIPYGAGAEDREDTLKGFASAAF